jgi:hypothetical protein
MKVSEHSLELYVDVDEDIAEHGFSYFKLVDWPGP